MSYLRTSLMTCTAAAALLGAVDAHADTFHSVTTLPTTDHARLLGPLDSRVVYSVERPGSAPEVRATDGTADVLLTNVGPTDARIDEEDAFGLVGGRFVFRNPFATTGELWSTGGTAATTVKVASASPILPTDGLRVVAPNLAWFTQYTDKSRDVWSTDGTLAGTKKIAACASNISSGALSFAQLGASTIFTNYGTSSNSDTGLWKSDGVTATRFYPGRYLRDAQKCGAYAYFVAAPAGGGVDLTPGVWRTDGTVAGTTFVGEGQPTAAACLGSTFLFGETSKVLRASTGGAAIAIGDDGTKFLDGPPAVAGGQAFFVGSKDVGGVTHYVLYRTDGTAAGTIPLADEVDPIGIVGTTSTGKVVGSIIGGAPGKFILSDGTSAGTVKTTITASVLFGPPAGQDKAIYFWASDAAHGIEPWTSDGTVAGTRLVDDVRPGPLGSIDEGDEYLHPFYLADDHLFTLADPDGIHGLQVVAAQVAPTKTSSKDGGADSGHDDPSGQSPPGADRDGGAADGENAAPGASGANADSGGCQAAGTFPSGVAGLGALATMGALATVGALRRRRRSA